MIMNMARYEQETIIGFNEEEKTAGIYTHNKVLRHVNLNIRPGENLALVGPSGGGKSTLVQLLLGLYTPQSGSIHFAGASQPEIGLQTIREHVAVVLQHPALFNDTVRANLTDRKSVV